MRADLQYKLELADELKGHRPFYFPVNMDFRGRAYPIPPHLSPTGSDISRGLLVVRIPFLCTISVSDVLMMGLL
jgi:DNA-directed RNA polymerase